MMIMRLSASATYVQLTTQKRMARRKLVSVVDLRAKSVIHPFLPVRETGKQI